MDFSLHHYTLMCSNAYINVGLDPAVQNLRVFEINSVRLGEQSANRNSDVLGNITNSNHFHSVWNVWSRVANSSSQMEFDLAAPPPKMPSFEVMKPGVSAVDLSASGD